MTRNTITILLAAAFAATSSPAAAKLKPVRCDALSPDFARGVEVVEALRAHVGPDGESRIETIKIEGKTGDYIGGTVRLTQFDFGDPTKAVIVYGFPNIYIPPHPAPYREIFILLAGSSEMRLPNGETYQLKPGSMVINEDMGSKTGRGGRAGPCGYVALDLQFKAKEPAR